jgi:D-alanyl-D-alanine carboxypeptidase/D-alanyl-D-alanine-endopeptidase (penicillin-binding protein 4)
MRAFLLALASALTVALAVVSPAGAQPSPSPQQVLTRALRGGMRQLGSFSGGYVVDLTTGQPLFAAAAGTGRLPASVEKLYTTASALLMFGPHATFTTSVFGRGLRGPSGTWNGTLYLRGGGDPTFGSASFDSANYGGGATIQRLVANLQHSAHLRALKGRVVGDSSYFDLLPGTVESGFTFDLYMEGALSAIAFNRGLLAQGTESVLNPPLFAAGQLAVALRAARVRLPKHLALGIGRTPASARLLGAVHSPSLGRLIWLTNTPSDNFFAETLVKDLGAQFGIGGTTAAGVAVIRAELATRFNLTPRLDDGSGLSRDDVTSPRQVVSLLTQMAGNQVFTNSLAVAGETGTLQDEMQGTAAQGQCRGKTGTLYDVASLAGYCQAADGHTLAFAFLANGLGDPSLGHAIEANMAVALAQYDG